MTVGVIGRADAKAPTFLECLDVSEDPYKVLGVPRDASDDDVRKAYRDLAKKYHPDLRPGDAEAEERFKAISAAYDIIGDSEKRKRYDNGEIDASGAEVRREFYRDYAESAADHPYHSSAGFEDLGDIFADLFGRDGGAHGQTVRMRGADLRYTLTVDFLEAASGARKRVTMPDGQVLDLTISEGLRDGQRLRLKGKGHPGLGGGPPGDAYVEVHVAPHHLFTRQGNDVHMELPISLGEAVLGGRVRVPTITGEVAMTVPKGSSTGATLRLRGKGISHPDKKSNGDQIVTLKVVMPKEIDQDLEAFMRQWNEEHAYDPRQGWGG